MTNTIQPISWTACYVLDSFAIALFAISYYRKCYRRGYRIDFWYAEVFLLCVFPNMLMLPFARSELNVIVLGRDLNAVIAVLPIIFLITMIGYLAVLVGGGLWRLRLGVGARDTATKILDVVPRCSMMLMSSRSVLVFQAALCLALQAMILAVYFSQSGFAFDLRSFTFANPSLRPVALVISNYSIIIAAHCLARYVDTKERILLACTLLLTCGLVFFGARGNILAIYMNVLICYVVLLRRKISLFRVISFAAIILALAFYLGNARAGEYSVTGLLGSLAFLLFYGNNFSDLRDFAWVYSAWDHIYWGGKTYVAALLAFIPRFASHFRDTWGLGVATASTVGFDPEVHPGVRPGAFGEGFFNFGLFGVIAVGLLLGIVVRRVDIDVKRALGSAQPSMMKAFASTMLLGIAGAFAVSAGFSGIYVLAGVYLFSWFCLSVQRMFWPQKVLVMGAK
ncbi:MAG TPA: oligosaccharide repeat unit polymerase [Terriglobales bacterium]|jgi:oligosaccharide repeat unit polymerase|nr:oligosaccharide repeat unit polymerase [Terriglobales bacterium]